MLQPCLPSASINSQTQPPPLPVCTALSPSGCSHTVQIAVVSLQGYQGHSNPMSPDHDSALQFHAQPLLHCPSLLCGKLAITLPHPDSSTPPLASQWRSNLSTSVTTTNHWHIVETFCSASSSPLNSSSVPSLTPLCCISVTHAHTITRQILLLLLCD